VVILILARNILHHGDSYMVISLNCGHYFAMTRYNQSTKINEYYDKDIQEYVVAEHLPRITNQCRTQDNPSRLLGAFRETAG
jgi:hypothetical protein